MFVINRVNTINEDKSINHLSNRKIEIHENKQILTTHKYLLSNINKINNKPNNKIASPFNLFSKKALASYPFKVAYSQPSDFLDKITQIGSRKNTQNPFQDFIKSLSISRKNSEVKKQTSMTVVSDINIITSIPKQTLKAPFSAEVLKITRENNEFVTLRIQRPKEWEFQPGQYLEIRGEDSGAEKPAILAIASGINAEYIEFTGRPSISPNHANYFFNDLIIGDHLTINGPLGSNFPLDLITSETPVILLGGGSGLTALKSVLESRPASADTKLIYSTKTYEDLIYKDEMENLKSAGHIISLTRDKVEGFAEERITEYIKFEELKPNTFFFLCGPHLLVFETAKLLVEKGIPKEYIYGSLFVTAEEGGPVFRGDHPKMVLV